MSLRSDLGRVKGLGSAKAGVHHWRLQRLTALALVPLSLWFVASLMCVFKASHAEVVQWVAQPHVTVLLLALSIALFWHLTLGVQVVIEDYVRTPWKQVVGQVLLRAGAGLGGLLAVVSILKISLGLN
ncbi:MAG: succinate dehydrogenase, hydrophobic membrane anchor protein [Gammaproteobacteria bacterium]|nr:succinate dehydrogenase, hydrophobic membrane anchor protein [Gammaproteobacteria bacterium]